MKAIVVNERNRYGYSPLPVGTVLEAFPDRTTVHHLENSKTGERAEVNMVWVRHPELKSEGWIPLDIVQLSNEAEVN